MALWTFFSRRLAQALMFAFLAIFGALSVAPPASVLPVPTEGTASADEREDLGGEEATLASAALVARKSGERSLPETAPVHGLTTQWAFLRLLELDAVRHRVIVTAFVPPPPEPPFRLLN